MQCLGEASWPCPDLKYTQPFGQVLIQIVIMDVEFDFLFRVLNQALPFAFSIYAVIGGDVLGAVFK